MAVDSGGEGIRMLTANFRRMRFGLGATLLTDAYFEDDLYGAPTWFAEYEADLGQALADPKQVFGLGLEEVWIREFERGVVIVNGMHGANFSYSVPRQGLRPLPLSKRPGRITGQREAPAWQLVIDNEMSAASAGGRCEVSNPFSYALGQDQCCDWWAPVDLRAGFRFLEDRTDHVRPICAATLQCLSVSRY